jgi:hypothetical protein
MVWSIDNWAQNYVLTDHKFYIWPWLAAVRKQTPGAFGECARTVRPRALDLHNQKMTSASVRKENCAVRKAKALIYFIFHKLVSCIFGWNCDSRLMKRK